MNLNKQRIKDSVPRRPAASRYLLLCLIMLVFFVANAAADDKDYRSKGQENWVRFTFELRDAQTGQPVLGRVYYQSEFAADWFHPDNRRPLLPPGVYRVIGWERHYWQSEQKLIVNPRKGLKQQVIIKLNPVTTRRDEGSSSAMKVPPILSPLVITGNTINKARHMNSSWFGQSSMATFSLFMNALSEYPGGSGGGSRSSSVNIYYYFFLKPDDAQKHFERLRPGFKTIPTSSQHVSGPAPVSLGDEALQIRIDTERGDRKGFLYETRKYLIRDGNFVVMMHIHKEVGLDFLTSPEEILNRIRSLDVRQLKLMLEPEPYPWPEITPPPGAGKDVDSLPDGAETNSSEDLAGGSIPEFTPAELAAASSLAGGAALVGALLLMGMSGVGREDIIQALRDLLRGHVPVDSFDAWRQKYEALGWKYNVTNGVATFDPVDGCRNEDGAVWSSQKGAFINADEPVAPPSISSIPKDGHVNERGEVWSTLSGGYVGRDMYHKDMASLVEIENAGRLRYDDNVYVREARTDFIEAKKAHLDSEIKLVEKTAELLSLNLQQLQEKESGSRFYTQDRDEFFRTTIDKAVQVMKEGKNLDRMTADLDAINDMIERQGRPVFEPQKTARDRIEDGMMRGVATVADLALTKGGMNALVSGFQTARDGILTGMSEGEALTRGTIQGAVEAATAGVGHLAGKFGMNQAVVMAGTNAAIGTATSFRDRIEQGQDLLSAAARSLGDGAFAGTTSYVTDKVTDMGLDKAQPYISRAKDYVGTKIVQPFVDKVKPVLKVPTAFQPKVPVDVHPDVAGKLHSARTNITTGQHGEKVLPMEDAKTLMRDSRTGRVMKPNPREFADVTEAHSNTVNNIKKAHDAATVSDYEKANPLSDAHKAKGVARRECKIEDFNTPGKKTTMSVDRDQRMVETLYDKDGNVISRREVPRAEWEGHSQKNFAEATNYNEHDFRKTLSPGEQKAFDGMSEGEKLKLYQEKHGWKCTDKFHTEASMDNSDQIIDPKTGKRITAGEPNILKVKRGEGTLQDAQGEGLMYVDKVRDAAASEQSVESFAQAKKAVETYDGLRNGYAAQNLETGTIKPGMRETMDVIKQNADAAAQGNPDAISRINDTLNKNGFKNMNDFADKIGGHIESLKWSRPKGG